MIDLSARSLFLSPSLSLDMVNIKVLNAGAWARSSERVPVSLPTEVSTHKLLVIKMAAVYHEFAPAYDVIVT